jgi:hypothetical protein
MRHYEEIEFAALRFCRTIRCTSLCSGEAHRQCNMFSAAKYYFTLNEAYAETAEIERALLQSVVLESNKGNEVNRHRHQTTKNNIDICKMTKALN